MIKLISYEEILPIWENELWVARKDPIEPISWMKYLGDYEDNSRMPTAFLGYYEDDKLVGVNSGHQCADGSYRSRGLLVNVAYRGKGIAKQLLLATIEAGKGSEFIWSFPRKSSWSAYQSVGFSLASEWSENINNTNAYCVLHYY